MISALSCYAISSLMPRWSVGASSRLIVNENTLIFDYVPFITRICAAVLKQLDDSSNDVQSIAVKCLGILLKKVQETQVGEICDKLC